MMAPTPKTTKMAGTNWWERVVVQRSASSVDAQVTTLTERSPLLLQGATTCPDSIALLYREEVKLGRLLGAGTYSNVYEVSGLELLEQHADAREGEPLLDSKARRTLKEAATSMEGGAKYAIKHLKADLLKDTKTFEHAACDLIMEAKFLSELSHPNILKMHGVAYGGAATFACTGLYDSFFILVDKIDETLSERLRRWRLESISKRQNPENTVLAKIEIALQVANALSYLHERRLVFRDLKPQNIGLTSEGIVQLFDFGFCRELPCESGSQMEWEVVPVEGGEAGEEIFAESHEHDDRLYGMSGKGTLMYMSPEVLGTRQYNRKADVYGWAAIFYEMLALQRPYTVESVEAHRQAIYKRGERPPLKDSGIPQPLQRLLINCWDGNIVNRFSMKEAKAHLEFIHSDFVPGILTTDSFHKCVSSTKKLLSPLHDALSTFANDVQAGYENLIGGIAVFPRQAEDNPAEEEGVGKNTMHTVPMGTTTHHTPENLTSSSSISGTSFAVDDDSISTNHGQEKKVDEEDPPGEEQEVVLADSVTTLEEETSKEISVQDCPKEVVEKETFSNTDGCYSTITLEEKDCSKLLPDGFPPATEVEHFEEIRRRREVPRSRNGTMVYHQFYGHMSLNIGKMAKDNRGNHEHLVKERSLWSIHCVARAA